MEGKFLASAAVTLLLGLLFYTQPTQAQISNSAEISEFISKPNTDDIEWIEIQNKTDQSLSLTDWYLTDLANPSNELLCSEQLLLRLAGTLPPRGVIRYEINERALNDGGDSIGLYQGEWQNPENLVHRVTYGKVIKKYSADLAAPALGQSGALINGSWQIANEPSKNWPNDKINFAALAAKEFPGYQTNLPLFSFDPTNANGLLLEKATIGKIWFNRLINLSDAGTIQILQDLPSFLKIEKNKIEFSPPENSQLNQGATLQFNGITLPEVTAKNILVDGQSSDLSDTVLQDTLNYDPTTGALSFSIKHFTLFEIAKSQSSSTSTTEQTTSTPPQEGPINDRPILSGGGAIFIPPAVKEPLGGFVIQTEAKQTTNKLPAALLRFNAGSDITGLAIAETEDFNGAGIMPYTSSTIYQLKNTATGRHLLYVKFYNQYGLSSSTIKAEITVINDGQTALIKNQANVATNMENSTSTAPQILGARSYADGILLRNRDDFRIFIVIAGELRYVPNFTILNLFYGHPQIELPAKDFNSLTFGQPLI